jgi:hypothetical protein
MLLSSSSSSAFSAPRVFHRVVKDSQLSQHGRAILLLPFAIVVCGSLGFDLIFDSCGYESRGIPGRQPTAVPSVMTNFFAEP